MGVCVADVLHPQKHASGEGEGAGRSIRPHFRMCVLNHGERKKQS